MIGGKTSGWGLGMRGKVALISTLGLGRFFFKKTNEKEFQPPENTSFSTPACGPASICTENEQKRGAPFFCSEDLRRSPKEAPPKKDAVGRGTFEGVPGLSFCDAGNTDDAFCNLRLFHRATEPHMHQLNMFQRIRRPGQSSVNPSHKSPCSS